MSETIKKTLLVVTPYFPPDGGGLERYAFEISKRLNESGNWKVVVLTSGIKRGKDILENIEGMKVIRLSYDLKISNTPFSCFWPGKIRKILKDEKPDLINIHMPVPGIGDVVTRLAKKNSPDR